MPSPFTALSLSLPWIVKDSYHPHLGDEAQRGAVICPRLRSMSVFKLGIQGQSDSQHLPSVLHGLRYPLCHFS